MPQQVSLLEEVLYNADILGCVIGYLYRPDAVRVRPAPPSTPPECQVHVLYYTF